MHALVSMAALLILPIGFYWYLRLVRSRAAAWAATSGFRLLETRHAWFPPLGMQFTTSDSQVIVRVKVNDENAHRIRSGWLRLGSYWRGLADGDAAEVRWDNT